MVLKTVAKLVIVGCPHNSYKTYFTGKRQFCMGEMGRSLGRCMSVGSVVKRHFGHIFDLLHFEFALGRGLVVVAHYHILLVVRE